MKISLYSSIILSTCVIGMAFALAPHLRAQTSPIIPPPTHDLSESGHRAEITMAGGCFWGVQGVFQHVRGVQSAVSGYAGGDSKQADYDTVSTGTTGNAESVHVVYDPQQVSLGQILRIYFSVAHDPTTLNAQGPDRGTQYRSAIFAFDDSQARFARDYLAQLDAAHAFSNKIVTQITVTRGFVAAETYHQNYLTLHPDQPYIAINDLPKVAALKAEFPKNYMENPVMVGEN